MKRDDLIIYNALFGATFESFVLLFLLFGIVHTGMVNNFIASVFKKMSTDPIFSSVLSFLHRYGRYLNKMF